ncbi:hypothetical protein DQQ10_26495 [Pseudochryseolinea flava]|uniref:Cytochrome c domain-containing protein n=2 Tax=Pseudochryseolinea flava TaxID=2059302 RepID=A0A364XUC6_9BACT|nr:hypothetical protein DQQ10_26495 [Pseudochryseolinea flava]
MRSAVGALMLIVVAVFFVSFENQERVERHDTLSAYGFFTGSLKSLNPAAHVIPYTVNTPLFSNYAEKSRFVIVPKGQKAVYNDSIAFDLPVGTILIKNFYYPLDFRNPDKGKKVIETRLLVHQSTGWEAWPYIWDEEQTEATYDAAGDTKTISYVDKNGKKITTPYVVPNKNQCKGCHIRDGKMKPIGVSARQLNGNYNYSARTENQLIYWQRQGLIDALPAQEQIPALAVWGDVRNTDLNHRARSYLDANCAHCHSRKGPANTSGLFLDIQETDRAHLGVNKSPIAAGRGAGDLQYDIVPGQPHKSILVYRMKTNDPAIAMPEIGREQIDKEGVALIEEWIKKNTF